MWQETAKELDSGIEISVSASRTERQFYSKCFQWRAVTSVATEQNLILCFLAS